MECTNHVMQWMHCRNKHVTLQERLVVDRVLEFYMQWNKTIQWDVPTGFSGPVFLKQSHCSCLLLSALLYEEQSDLIAIFEHIFLLKPLDHRDVVCYTLWRTKISSSSENLTWSCTDYCVTRLASHDPALIIVEPYWPDRIPYWLLWNHTGQTGSYTDCCHWPVRILYWLLWNQVGQSGSYTDCCATILASQDPIRTVVIGQSGSYTNCCDWPVRILDPILLWLASQDPMLMVVAPGWPVRILYCCGTILASQDPILLWNHIGQSGSYTVVEPYWPVRILYCCGTILASQDPILLWNHIGQSGSYTVVEPYWPVRILYCCGIILASQDLILLWNHAGQSGSHIVVAPGWPVRILYCWLWHQVGQSGSYTVVEPYWPVRISYCCGTILASQDPVFVVEPYWPVRISYCCGTILASQDLILLWNHTGQSGSRICCGTILASQDLILLWNHTGQSGSHIIMEPYWPVRISYCCGTILASQDPILTAVEPGWPQDPTLTVVIGQTGSYTDCCDWSDRILYCCDWSDRILYWLLWLAKQDPILTVVEPGWPDRILYWLLWNQADQTRFNTCPNTEASYDKILFVKW